MATSNLIAKLVRNWIILLINLTQYSMKLTLSTLLIFCIALTSFGQQQWSTKSKKAIKYVENSRLALREIDPETGFPHYRNAIALCDKAIAKDPNFIEAYFAKGDYARDARQYDVAIEAYKKTLEINPRYSRTGFVYSDLAELEWHVGKYEDALMHAKQFKTIPAANHDKFSEMDWIIINCEFAIEAIKHPLEFSPKNLGQGVNTSNSEYLPTLTVDQDELLFTRLVRDPSGRSIGQEDFFVSAFENEIWQTGVSMPKNINTPYNEGAPTYAPDGRTLIFVGCVSGRGYGANRRGYGSCDLFITQKVGNTWLDPVNLPGEVNTPHWETQPSLSSDGKTLYFIRGTVRSSGGRNKRNGDIYVSKLQADGSWGVAEKLPDYINTPFSESSVLIHPDGKTLYFGSNGHVGMGGSDIYMTELQPDGTWSKPRNLGYPINTSNNESSLLVFANGDYAIFDSNRPGGFGKSDLYGFEMPEAIRPTRTIYMTGLVFDQTNQNKLHANFSLIDLETGKEVVFSQSDHQTGKFLVTLPVNKEYALSVYKNGYQPYSVNFNLIEDENNTKPFHQDVPLVPLNDMSTENVLKNVFFDVDSYKLRTKSYVELNLLVSHLKQHPNLKIELQGHTDAQGDDDHNMTLSANRAQAVMDYLINKGIDKERLSFKGFGETKPATITNASGQKVTLTEAYINTLPKLEQKAAHQQNRRTVYIVKSL